jgi:hypothetical protein
MELLSCTPHLYMQNCADAAGTRMHQLKSSGTTPSETKAQRIEPQASTGRTTEDEDLNASASACR